MSLPLTDRAPAETSQQHSVPLGQVLYTYRWDINDLIRAEDDLSENSLDTQDEVDRGAERREAEMNEFLKSYRDTLCGSKTFGEIASYIEDVMHDDGITFPFPSDSTWGQTRQPSSMQVTGRDKSILSHRPAMTCALLRGDHFAAALISTMQALDGSKVSVSNTERSTVFDIIDRELNSWIHYGRPVEPRIQDLQDLRKQLVSDHVEQEARDILSVDLRCTPNLQEGSPAKDPDGAKRFIETLNANLLYHEYTFNTVLTQGSLPRQLSLREQTYLMPPGLVNDLNRYVAPEGYNWITGPNCFEMLPQPSELLYVKDPLVQSYIRSLGEPRSMIGHSPEAMRYIAGSAELLSNLKPFLNYKDRRSFSEASRLRACAASGESDPGPTVSEHYQSQNPYDYALSYLKEDGKNGQIDFDDPNTIDPFLPHQALAIHRHRQSIQSSKS